MSSPSSPILRAVETDFAHTPYRAQMNKWPSERLFAAASAVRELQDSPGWAVVLELMEGVREDHEAQLIFGQAVDDATVSRLRGAVAGLKSAEVAAEAVLKAAQDVEQDLNEKSRQTAGAER